MFHVWDIIKRGYLKKTAGVIRFCWKIGDFSVEHKGLAKIGD